MICNCGLEMSKNPHPSAGDPTYEGVEVGYQFECIPCLVKARNRVGREMRKAQAEVERLRALVALHEEYEAFLNEANEGPISLAAAHGWRCPKADVDRGIEYRQKMAELGSTGGRESEGS